MSRPLISIVTITYNQEKYLAQTIESIVSQKHDNFDIELIIADDQSTDKTSQIIDKYEKAYPKLIKSVVRSKNVGIQKNLIDALSHSKGRYVALCEGDDFWTDKTKLQRQVDFMETNSDYALVFHPTKVFFEKGIYPDSKFPDRTKQFTHSDLLRANFIPTNSVMYRRLKSYDNLREDMMPFDWYLHNLHARQGKIGFINRTMAAYRRHEGGAWWASHNDAKKFWESYGPSLLSVLDEFRGLYGDQPEMIEAISEGEYSVGRDMLRQGINPSDHISSADGQKRWVERLTADFIVLEAENKKLHKAAEDYRRKTKSLKEEISLLKKDLSFYMRELEKAQLLYDGLRNTIKNPTKLLVRVLNRKKSTPSDKL